MPIYEVETNQGTFEVDLNREPNSPEELQTAIASQLEQFKTQKNPPAWASTLSKFYRPLLEFGGLTAGGIAGLPVAPPFGSIGGAGLLYAGGKQTANILDELLGLRTPPPLSEQLPQTGKDILTGATIEASGQAIGVAATGIFRGIGKLGLNPRKLYASALKPVPSLPTAQRESAISTGLKLSAEGGPYRPTAKHVLRLHERISTLVDQADNIVIQAGRSGQTISTKPLTASIDDVISEFKTGPFPSAEVKVLEGFKKQISSRGENIPVNEALAMKKRIYQLAKTFYKNPRVSIAPVKIEAEKAIARAIRAELEDLFPATAPLNKQASELIDFGKVLARSTSRVENRELLSIFDLLGATVGGTVAGGPGATLSGLGMWASTNAQFKSLIAKEMNKATIPGNVKQELIRQLFRFSLVKGNEMQPIPETLPSVFP